MSEGGGKKRAPETDRQVACLRCLVVFCFFLNDNMKHSSGTSPLASLAPKLTVPRLFADVGAERVKQQNDLSSLTAPVDPFHPNYYGGFFLSAAQDVS